MTVDTSAPSPAADGFEVTALARTSTRTVEASSTACLDDSGEAGELPTLAWCLSGLEAGAWTLGIGDSDVAFEVP